MNRRWFLLGPLAGVVFVACSGSGTVPIEARAGTLELALTATDSQGELYRLRNASFYIEGYPQYYNAGPAAGAGGGGGDDYYYFETVSTEANPNEAVITRRVVPGQYYVSFASSGSWYIEHVTASGPVRVQKSVLLSAAQQYAYVYDGGATTVSYQFGVDGNLVDFRHGDIKIKIGIEHPDENNGGGGAGGAFAE